MKLFRNILCIILVLSLGNCKEDFLDLKPTDKMEPSVLFSDPDGVQLFMANLYYKLPIEDFMYSVNVGFNVCCGNPPRAIIDAHYTDEAIHPEGPNQVLGDGGGVFWAYNYVRDINLLIETVPTLEISEAEKTSLLAEASFLRAYAYYAMAKRYGGVPIIKEVQKFTGSEDVTTLRVPRSTEKETWDFVMSECDAAIAGLPEVHPSSSRRANKYVALALKSRAALFAGSVAKFWNKAPLTGPAVDEKLVGMSASDANGYYKQCIDASEAVMNSGKYALYKPNPANPEEAAENYRKLFEDPNIALAEAIFIKGFTAPIPGQSHDYDLVFTIRQLAASNGGRMNPTLDLVDAYESYSNPGYDAPIVTTTDGITDDYNGFDKDKPYIRFNNPLEIFKDKDARLFGTVVLPGSTWRGVTIVIQGGYVQPDGVAMIETAAGSITVNGKKYYTYGAADEINYSGFDNAITGKMTRTGFGFKKFIQQGGVIAGRDKSTSDWIDMRYAEVLLNYAEAVVESGITENNAQEKAAVAMNSTRRRAGHTVDIPLTVENVQRERKIEKAFENNRMWDLIRRREYHEVFSGLIRHALVPVIDLRVDPPQYIFVRQNRQVETPRYFLPYNYYRRVPANATNALVQNPEYQ